MKIHYLTNIGLENKQIKGGCKNPPIKRKDNMQKKITIKWEEVGNCGGQQLMFYLPDGREMTATEIGWDMVETGEDADPNQYRYRTKYSCDEYGFDLDEFDGKDIVKYGMRGFLEYDENTLKFCKKVLLYWCKAYSDNWEADEFEMPSKYLELLNG